jgi:putative ABC transport system permease protein
MKLGKGAGTGPARQAVVRWAWRMFRREWRQQALVIVLLTVTVAAAVAGVSMGWGAADTSARTFGSANHLLQFDASDPTQLAHNLAEVDKRFDDTEEIGRRYEAIPGTAEDVELRSQDPDGPLGRSMLDLRNGRYPDTAGEVALTDDMAVLLDVGIGDTTKLGDQEWTVVGLVENPSDFGDEFGLLAAEADNGPLDAVTVLVDAPDDELEALADAFDGPLVRESRGANSEQAFAAGTMLSAATVVMLLVCFVAAAGFAVVAQRRLRQLGMLAAVGATEKHLRLVMVADGVAVGAAATLVGTALGLVGWVLAAPWTESAAGHRIDRVDLPWSYIGLVMALAVVTTTVAAWWPARSIARVPIIQALSARAPRPRRVHRSVVLGVALLVVGITSLVLANEKNGLLIVVGTLTTILGVLAICPIAVRALGRVAKRAPVAVRLSLRDLARYQSRSGAALAAICMGLGIPLAMLITLTADDYRNGKADRLGTLSDRQMLVRAPDWYPLVPEWTPEEQATQQAQIDAMAADFDHATVSPLAMVVDLDSAPEGGVDGQQSGRPVVELGWPMDSNTFQGDPLYVATPELLARYGVDLATLDPSVDVLASSDVLGNGNIEDFEYLGIAARGEHPKIQQIDAPDYTHIPDAFITPAGLRRSGLDSVWAARWLVESASPMTDAQFARARAIAAASGLEVETRQEREPIGGAQLGVALAGAVLALAVLAMTVGLIRGEAAGDLRTLTAAGATSRARRVLTASTAGALALLGVLLATVGAYAALLAGHHKNLEPFAQVPVVHLVGVALGVPLAAVMAGWLLAGREPPAIARGAIE